VGRAVNEDGTLPSVRETAPQRCYRGLGGALHNILNPAWVCRLTHSADDFLGSCQVCSGAQSPAFPQDRHEGLQHNDRDVFVLLNDSWSLSHVTI